MQPWLQRRAVNLASALMYSSMNDKTRIDQYQYKHQQMYIMISDVPSLICTEFYFEPIFSQLNLILTQFYLGQAVSKPIFFYSRFSLTLHETLIWTESHPEKFFIWTQFYVHLLLSCNLLLDNRMAAEAIRCLAVNILL